MSKSGKTINAVIIITIIVKILGISRELIFSYFFGANYVSDSYNLAQTIPVTLFSIVSLAIGTTLIPIMEGIKKENQDILVSKEKINLFISNVVYVLLIICTAISFIVCIFPNFFIVLFASKISNETFELASLFLRISIFSIFFIALTYVFTAFLRIKKKHTIITISSAIIPIISIVSYIIAFRTNDIYLAFGILIAHFFQVLILFIISIRNGFKFKKFFSINDCKLIEVFKLSLPIIIVVGIDEINTIIDKNIASGFDVGSISLLSYANVIPTMLHTIIVVSINAVLFSDLSSFFANKDEKSVNSSLFSSYNKAFFFLIPATLGILLFSKLISEAVFMRGNFTKDDAFVTGRLMFFYSIKIIPNVIRIFSLSILNANKNTKVQILIGTVTVGTNICLNFLLSHFLGLYGLALATSISACVAAVMSFCLAKKYIKSFKIIKILQSLLLIMLLSVVCIFPYYILYKYCLSRIINNSLLNCLIVVVCSAVTYFCAFSLFYIIKKKKKNRITNL